MLYRYIGLVFTLPLFLFSCQNSSRTAHQSPTEVLQSLDINTDLLHGDQLEQFMQEHKEQLLIVDLSKPADFRLGHIEGAVNMPLTLLMEKENLDMLKNHEHIVLSGVPFTQSAATLVLLRQMGIEGLKLVDQGEVQAETAQYDFAEVFKTTKEKHAAELEAGKPKPVVVEVPTAKKAIKPQPKPKKKVVVEEEEGC
jgi:rhodanese-related sulfurtransferase